MRKTVEQTRQRGTRFGASIDLFPKSAGWRFSSRVMTVLTVEWMEAVRTWLVE